MEQIDQQPGGEARGSAGEAGHRMVGDMSPTTSHHDVVVVGSRCAGASTAMLLAQQGVDVVTIDRSRFPSDTLSTHSLARGAVVQLHRWGILDEVLASGAPAIREVSFHIGDTVIRKDIKAAAGVDHLVAPRRHILDDILLRAAEQAGARVRTGVTVTDVTRAATGRVDGVVGRGADGEPVELHARFVVGADGLRSRIARAVDAPVTDQRHANGACHYTYVADLDFQGTEFHLSDGGFVGLFPTHCGEANVWVSTPVDRAEGLRGGVDRNRAFRDLVAEISPAFADRLAAARQTAPVRGFSAMPNLLRQPVGDGWALVGDASYFRDAITGHGMTDAFRDAEHLARTIGAVLAGDVDEADAMARYHARRDEMVSDLFEITCALALFPAPDRFSELQKQLSRCIEAEAESLAALPPIRPVGAFAA
ncbi:FAD-dependent monooxygenase [Acidimicrobiia bacterium EGI L10123]|uniref:NAD(P)/FAD-dependent oxidoreductase n=1 Tax=Salinilacustrithrix flava TaxID=2957203 RepID=UPI003D7C2960|nr:FAD-dependent monooxygenase [Acidimicrobiia bacterium EGI L10123]